MSELKNVKCQAKHDATGGCATCGGYEIILAVRKCPSCGHCALVRPGSYTSYEGKKWRTFDGVEITDHFKNPSTCSYCREVTDER